MIKKYQLGVIPHYVDYEFVKKHFSHLKDVLIINLMTNNVEDTTDEILQCKHIISSSLHGIIVAHAYRVPALWIKFSDKPFGDDIKFKDYFKSVKIQPYVSFTNELLNDNENIEKFFKEDVALPDQNVINNLKEGLMDVCPFK